MSDHDDRIEAAKRRIRAPEGFTPEHMGLSDRGNPLTLAEAMPGGGVVADKASLKAQSEPDVEELNVLAPDYEATMIQREAAKELAEEDQADAEKQAKADEREQAKSDREDAAEKRQAKPVKVIEDTSSKDDKPAI